MNSRLKGLVSAGAVAASIVVIASVAIGCGGVNPFLSTQFWTNSTFLQQLQQNNVPAFEQRDTTQLTSVCDLDATQPALRTLQITVRSESQQRVKFSMTLLVSAGAGGFVCDDAVQDYLNAGYTDRINNTVGCDTIVLGGSRLLSLSYGINQGAGATLPPATYDAGGTLQNAPEFQLRRHDTGSLFLPLPQVIVFGNEDANFECVGGPALGDLCSQRGFVYVTAADVLVGKAVEASRIQGTLCNTGFGSVPEWRLDTTLNDGLTQPFQYANGGTIVVTVLDRSGDPLTTNRNQAVWLVTNSAGTTIQSESR